MLGLTITDGSVLEGESLIYTVTVDTIVPYDVVVNYEVTPGSSNPVEAADFPGSVFPSGQVTINGNSTGNATITIPTFDEDLVEALVRHLSCLPCADVPSGLRDAASLEMREAR